MCAGGFLEAVAADGFDRAAAHCLLAEGFLFWGGGLLVDEAVAAIVVASEVCGSRFAAQVAINALVVHIEGAGDVLRVFVSEVSHREVFLEARENRLGAC